VAGKLKASDIFDDVKFQSSLTLLVPPCRTARPRALGLTLSDFGVCPDCYTACDLYSYVQRVSVGLFEKLKSMVGYEEYSSMWKRIA
jgi:hypothetical protein